MKKQYLLLLIITLLFSACGGATQERPYAPSALESISIDKQLSSDYQIYTQKMLGQRTDSFKLFENIQNKATLSGADLDALHRMLAQYIENKDSTNQYVNAYQYLLDGPVEEYNEEERFIMIMMSLSAMLIRYDDYLLSYQQYQNDSKLRDILNSEDSAYGIPTGTLSSIVTLYESSTDRENIKRLIRYYDSYKGLYSSERDALFVYLTMLIEDSPSYKLGFDNEESLFDALDSWINEQIDTRDSFFSLIFSELSADISNTAGLVEIREGKLNGDANAAANIRLKIQAGDILLEKTPFRLTDKLIPGYWGHIAVYIGTQEELVALGIWDDPVVQAHKEEILAQKEIVEALRDGVQLNSIEHFLNVDDIGIMHYDGESIESKKARILLTLRQLGKEYDFEYDVEDTSKLICSELVYITFLDIDWQTENLVGVNTISPDNVVLKSVEEDAVFSIPLLYHDGLEVTSELKSMMQTLLDEG